MKTHMPKFAKKMLVCLAEIDQFLTEAARKAQQPIIHYSDCIVP